jgi:hypothetical protein
LNNFFQKPKLLIAEELFSFLHIPKFPKAFNVRRVNHTGILALVSVIVMKKFFVRK